MLDCSLSEKTSICNFKDCIDSISTFYKNSASFSDGWIFNLKDKTSVKDKSLDKVFVKMFVDPNSFNKVNKKKISKNNKGIISKELVLSDFKSEEFIYKCLKNLQYEIKIYKKVIKPLVDLNICPNFINYISSSKCNYGNLFELLKGKIKFDTVNNVNISFLDRFFKKNLKTDETIVDTDENKIKGVLNRTIIEKLLRDFVENPTVNSLPLSSLNQYKEYIDKIPSKEYKYSMFMIEYIDNSVTFFQFLQNRNHTVNDFWNVYLQIAISCYTLYLNKTNHNDLHGDNIFIYTLDKPELFLYKVGDKEYKIFTRYIPLIYDFDLAYCEKLGKNVVEFKKDYFIILNNYKINYNTARISETKDFFSTLSYVSKINNLWEFVNQCLTSSDMPAIIEIMYSKTEKYGKRNSVPKENVYNCSKRVI